ncbi:enoyl-CoA hydratase/isomerase family protein [Microaerobacter geothermalis]|uniref:enoyl-CoA hydratase/isomerase family protein n=1 Tax=Microaerobacter geothermalis TaxID=674972 RepID=UPI001F170E34|nr:enoyl-CoA hydratase/isomerase family protein [Microaerobacter geothermalis]MCF6093568.1 enoyl-CoA hydratase/isomerase family protein [Microaerobacter geothermalis]
METISYKKIDGIGIIALNRPEVRNAINFKMMDELEGSLQQAWKDHEVKVIVITGEGEKAFAAGGDLQEFHGLKTKNEALVMLKRMSGILSSIERSPKPIIAGINGVAVGGGCELALACHIRLCSEHAKLGFVQIGLGITTGWGGGTRILHKLGLSKGLTLLLTGEVIKAEKALQMGLVDEVFPADHFLEHLIEFAKKISQHPLQSILAYMKIVKQMGQGTNFEELKEMEIDQCATLWETPIHHHEVERFLAEKIPDRV